MGTIDDIKRSYNSPEAVAKREEFQKEIERQKIEKEKMRLKEREEAIPFVNYLIEECKEASKNGLSCLTTYYYISTAAEDILKEKGFKVATWNQGQYYGGNTISGW